jgi:hypothetical protein
MHALTARFGLGVLAVAALAAVKRAIRLNPKLATQARQDNDMAALRGELP